MKREGSGTRIIIAMAVLLTVVVAIGAGLQSQLNFAGPLWTPNLGGSLPKVRTTPTPQPLPTAAPEAHSNPVTFSWVPITVVLGVLGLAVIVTFILLYLRNRPRRGSTVEFSDVDVTIDDLAEIGSAPADVPTLRRGLLRAVDVLGSDREPRDAIVRAWLGLQEAAEDSGMTRKPAETPTEFTTRVFASVDADQVAAGTLLQLYLRVRFGDHPATADDVERARTAVTALTATWPVSSSR